MPEEIVYALHNFEAENEDEISFTTGEPIVVLEKDEKYQDGWWQGRNIRGQVGLFPENYTTSKKPQQQQLASPPTASSSMLSASSSNSGSHKQTTSLFSEERHDSAISQIDLLPNDKLGTSPPPPPPPPPASIMQQAQPPPSVPPPTPPEAKAANAGANKGSNPEDWSIDQVAEWLQSVGLSNVADNFIEQEITGDILLSLTSESLKELGITAYGRRYRVMNAVEKLKAEHNKPIAAAAAAVPASSTSSSLLRHTPPSINMDAASMQQQPPSLPLRSPPRSPVTTDSMYEFPRKAPMPPLAGANAGAADIHSSRRPTDSLLTISAKSPASSSTVSRSNTFQTFSSKVSSSSSSVRSRERSPDPARATGTFSHRMTQKSTLSDSQDLDVGSVRPSIDATNTYAIRENGNYPYDHYTNDHENIQHPTSPLDTRSRNMSVASVEPYALPRMSTNSYQPPEHEGWLHKQGDKYKTWNKRWFVLKGPNLFYFKSPKDVRMKGIIHLKGYKIIADESIYPGKYSFKAQHDRERTFFFYTDTKESMRTWIKMLMKATITRDFDAPVMSSSHVATIPLDVARQMRPRPPSMIMYNRPQQQQQQQPKLVHPADTTLREEDEALRKELEHTPIHDGLGSNLSDLSHKQLRESGITVWPHGALGNPAVADAPPDMPDKFLLDDDAIPAPTLSSSIVMSDEDEDMIDPHHHKGFLATPSPSSSGAAASIDRKSSRSSSGSIREAAAAASISDVAGSNGVQQPRTWTRAQYLDWINKYLPPGKRVIDLTNAFRNGDTLILLLEALSGKTVRRPPTPKGGSVSMQMLDNIVAAFKFMGREGVVVDGRYTIKDIFGGNESKIMDMLDAIRTWSEENEFSEQQQQQQQQQ